MGRPKDTKSIIETELTLDSVKSVLNISSVFITLSFLMVLFFVNAIKYPDIITGKSVDMNVSMSDKKIPIILAITEDMALKGYKVGEISPGQKVNIKLDDYPFSEFGVIRGQVKTSANLENECMTIELENGLLTSFNRTIPANSKLVGRMEISGNNLSVMSRILDNLFK